MAIDKYKRVDIEQNDKKYDVVEQRLFRLVEEFKKEASGPKPVEEVEERCDDDLEESVDKGLVSEEVEPTFVAASLIGLVMNRVE
mgnify:CR=1 FL=1